LVAADDRTGALETAGAIADAGLRARMVPRAAIDAHELETTGALVVDLATRHRPPAEAAARALESEGWAAVRAAHKIDSLLRGRWAHELVARASTGRRVLLVPAFPAAGRTCADGEVLVGGRPVAELVDARSPVSSSRPAEHLLAAGAGQTDALHPLQVAAWLAGAGRMAVCDASTGGELAHIARAWALAPAVLLAGPAGAIGAAAAALATEPARPWPTALGGPALVVCGSVHPTARAQVAALLAAGGVAVDGVAGAVDAIGKGCHAVVANSGDATTDPDAEAARLASVARGVLAAAAVDTLVLVGGDTAAAVLGDEPLDVDGTLAPGVAVARLHSGITVVTKPGSFGAPGLLVALLSGRMTA